MRGKFYILFVFFFGLLPFVLAFIRLFRQPIVIVYPLNVSPFLFIFYLFIYLFLFVIVLYSFLKYYFWVNSVTTVTSLRSFILKVSNYYQKPFDYVERFFWRNPLSFFKYFYWFFFYFYNLFYKWDLSGRGFDFSYSSVYVRKLYIIFVFYTYFVLVFCIFLVFYDVIFCSQLKYTFVALFILVLNELVYFIYLRFLSYLYVRRLSLFDVFVCESHRVFNILWLSDNNVILKAFKENILSYDGFILLDFVDGCVDSFKLYFIYCDVYLNVFYLDVYVLHNDCSLSFFLSNYGYNWEKYFKDSFGFRLSFFDQLISNFTGHSLFIKALRDYRFLLYKHKLIQSIVRLLAILFLITYLFLKSVYI